MNTKQTKILTIGHSNHTYADFLGLLRRAGVTAVADVRTAPFSRHNTQFNKEELQQALKRDRVAYVYLGVELGGRPKSKALFDDGIADYEQMAATSLFAEGLERVVQGASSHRIALMCSEQNPTECHRCLLVGRALQAHGVQVEHILSDGSVVSQEEVAEELLRLSGSPSEDLFLSKEERLTLAYRERSRRVAYSEKAEENSSENRQKVG